MSNGEKQVAELVQHFMTFSLLRTLIHTELCYTYGGEVLLQALGDYSYTLAILSTMGNLTSLFPYDNQNLTSLFPYDNQ